LLNKNLRQNAIGANSIDHHNEWIEACKNGGVTTYHFDYSAVP
jgi:hypothetical protein